MFTGCDGVVTRGVTAHCLLDDFVGGKVYRVRRT